MSNIDKIYSMSLDIKDIKNVHQTNAIFYEDDRNTSVLKINLLNNNTKIDLTDYTVTAMFLLPGEQAHTHTCTDIDVENGVVNLELPAESLKVGLCYLILSIGNGLEMSHTPLVTYTVKKGATRDLTPADPNVPTLQQLILDVQVVKVDQDELYTQFEEKFNLVSGIQKDYDSLRRVIIDENQAANLQVQIDENASALETIENEKSDIIKGVFSSPTLTSVQRMEVLTTATRLCGSEVGRKYVIIQSPSDLDISIAEGWGDVLDDNAAIYETLPASKETIFTSKSPIWAKASKNSFVLIKKEVVI